MIASLPVAEGEGGAFLFLMFLTLGALVYFLPSIVAFKRGHGYRNVILVMNLFAFTGVLWLIAMIWAVFPAEKALIDPVVGNFTGTGRRNSGDALGNARYGLQRGYEQASGTSSNDSVLDELNKLADLRNKGALSEAEYEAMKQKLVRRLS